MKFIRKIKDYTHYTDPYFLGSGAFPELWENSKGEEFIKITASNSEDNGSIKFYDKFITVASYKKGKFKKVLDPENFDGEEFLTKIYIQKGYDSREKTACINYCNSQKNESYELEYVDCVSQIISNPECIIGSVEFIEQYIGSRKPDCYPSWADEFLRRFVDFSEYPYYHSIMNDELKKNYFVKPSDKYKRFEAFVFDINKNKSEYEKIKETPCYISDVVNFVDEWRYYVINGEVVSSWWYKGSDETCEKNPNGPHLKMKIPKYFCGAIDMGMLDTGEFALVEVQHPYAIGWYGEQDDFENYLNFLIEGFKSL